MAKRRSINKKTGSASPRRRNLQLLTAAKAAKVLGLTVGELDSLRHRQMVCGIRVGSVWKYKQQEIERVVADLRSEADAAESSPLEEGVGSLLLSESELAALDPTRSGTIIGNSCSKEPTDSDFVLSDSDDDDLILGSPIETVYGARDSGISLIMPDGSGIELDDLSDEELLLGTSDQFKPVNGAQSSTQLEPRAYRIPDGLLSIVGQPDRLSALLHAILAQPAKSVSSVQLSGNMALVMADRDSHQRIDRLLKQVQAEWKRPAVIRLVAYWLWLNDEQFDGLITKPRIDSGLFTQLQRQVDGSLTPGYRASIILVEGQTALARTCGQSPIRSDTTSYLNEPLAQAKLLTAPTADLVLKVSTGFVGADSAIISLDVRSAVRWRTPPRRSVTQHIHVSVEAVEGQFCLAGGITAGPPGHLCLFLSATRQSAAGVG